MKALILLVTYLSLNASLSSQTTRWLLDGWISNARIENPTEESIFKVGGAFSISLEFDPDSAPYEVTARSSYTRYRFLGGQFKFELSDGSYIGISEISEISKYVYHESNETLIIFKPAYRTETGEIESNNLDFFPPESGTGLCEIESSLYFPSSVFPNEDRLIRRIRYSDVPWFSTGGHIVFSDNCSNGSSFDLLTQWFFADDAEVHPPELSIESVSAWGDQVKLVWVAHVPVGTEYYLHRSRDSLAWVDSIFESYSGSGRRVIHVTEVVPENGATFFTLTKD